jgi:dsDNA-specific endonuclease/ATPase MutS2
LAEAEDEEAEMLEQQIDELHARVEELEREQQFHEIRREHRERVWELEMEIAEIQQYLAEEEEEHAEVRRALARARIEHLTKVRDLCRQIATLRGPEELRKAFELLEQIELAQMRWRMVESPKVEGAVRIHEMEAAAAELDNPPELLIEIEKAKQLRLAVIAAAEDLFERWQKHHQQRREMEQAMDGFWRKLERARAGPERLP